jgi:hypothetical protein
VKRCAQYLRTQPAKAGPNLSYHDIFRHLADYRNHELASGGRHDVSLIPDRGTSRGRRARRTRHTSKRLGLIIRLEKRPGRLEQQILSDFDCPRAIRDMMTRQTGVAPGGPEPGPEA